MQRLVPVIGGGKDDDYNVDDGEIKQHTYIIRGSHLCYADTFIGIMYGKGVGMRFMPRSG